MRQVTTEEGRRAVVLGLLRCVPVSQPVTSATVMVVVFDHEPRVPLLRAPDCAQIESLVVDVPHGPKRWIAQWGSRAELAILFRAMALTRGAEVGELHARLDELQDHLAVVMLPPGGRVFLQMWPPAEVLAARGLS